MRSPRHCDGDGDGRDMPTDGGNTGQSPSSPSSPSTSRFYFTGDGADPDTAAAPPSSDGSSDATSETEVVDAAASSDGDAGGASVELITRRGEDSIVGVGIGSMASSPPSSRSPDGGRLGGVAMGPVHTPAGGTGGGCDPNAALIGGATAVGGLGTGMGPEKMIPPPPVDAPSASTCSLSTYRTTESSMWAAAPSVPSGGSGGGSGVRDPARLSSQLHPESRGERRRRRISSVDRHSLLLRQLRLLSAMAGTSLFLFLFAFLGIFGLVLLCTTLGLSLLLFNVAYEYGALTHENILRTGGYMRYLPEWARRALTETTLHEFMIDPSTFLEYRYLLLYFVPGLTPEQLEGIIRNLPPRRRDTLLRPGYARALMPDSVMGALLPPVAPSGEEQLGEAETRMLIQRGVVENAAEEGRGQEEATMQDAINGLFGTVSSAFLNSRMPVIQEEMEDLNLQDDDAISLPPIATVAVNVVREVPRDLVWPVDDAASTFGGESEDEAIVQMRTHSVELVHPQDTSSEERQLLNQRELESEQSLEEQLLSGAMSRMVENYTSSFRTAVTDFTRNLVQRIAPIAMRVGISVSYSSGLGLLGMWFVRFAAPTGRIGGAPGRMRGGYSSAVTYGLIGTMSSGMAVAGVMRFAREWVQSPRDRSGEDGNLSAENTDKPGSGKQQDSFKVEDRGTK